MSLWLGGEGQEGARHRPLSPLHLHQATVGSLGPAVLSKAGAAADLGGQRLVLAYFFLLGELLCILQDLTHSSVPWEAFLISKGRHPNFSLGSPKPMLLLLYGTPRDPITLRWSSGKVDRREEAIHNPGKGIQAWGQGH